MTEQEQLAEKLNNEIIDLQDSCSRLAPMEIYDMSRDIEFYVGMSEFLITEMDDLNPFLIKDLLKLDDILNTLYVKYFEPIRAENCKDQYTVILTNFLKDQKRKLHGEMC